MYFKQMLPNLATHSTVFIADTLGIPRVSVLIARVRRSSGNLFQSNVCNLFFAGDLAAVRIIGVSVIARCPQDESLL